MPDTPPGSSICGSSAFSSPAPGRDPGNHRLEAANLAALWADFSDHGARRLVVVGPVEDHSQVRLYTEAVPA